MSFPTRSIGSTDVRVSTLSFGCASIGNLYRESTDATAAEVLEAAWHGGIRYFDTAPHYGRGLSEQRLGNFLRDGKRDNCVISTKVGRVLSPGPELDAADGFVNPLNNDVRYDYSADGIDASLMGSRTRLGTDYIDIVYVHDIGEFTHGTDNKKHTEAFLNSGYKRLTELKEAGKIGAIGIGVNEVEVCIDLMQHCSLDVILLAGRLTLLDRSADAELLPLCSKTNTSLVLGGIFNSGILATGAKPGATYNYAPASDLILKEVDMLEAKAVKLGMSLPEAAIQFAQNHPVAVSVLIGTASEKSLSRNISMATRAVPDHFWETFS